VKSIKGKIEEKYNSYTTVRNKKSIEYLKKIILLHDKKRNRFPKIAWLLKKTGHDRKTLNKQLKILINEEMLIYENNRLSLNPERAFKIVRPKDKLKKIREISSDSKKWFEILRYVLLFIGVGAVYMSIHYSYLWLVSFLHPARAFLLAFILVAFAVSAFELIVFFYQSFKISLVTIFSVLWLIVTVFSMTSTVAGQYNSRIADLDKRYNQDSSIKNEDSKMREYQEQKLEYKETLQDLREDSQNIQKLLAYYDSPEKIEANRRMYNQLQWKYNKIQRQIEITTKRLEKLRSNKKYKFIKKNAPDFYVWISDLWGWRPEMVQFFMSVFPAIFIDLISPLSFAVVMFVRSDYGENK
jgi:hypothetical protein